MKKIFLLPFCISCVCGISACNIQTHEQDTVVFVDEEDVSIDTTNNSENRCGANGTSCNDSALVNYTKTETDYREYGERTRRDHLYTQAATGNNLTASIRPSIEDDVVIAPIERPVQPQKPHFNDGAFQRTTSSDVGFQPQAYNNAPTYKERLGVSNNIHPNNRNINGNRPFAGYVSDSNRPFAGAIAPTMGAHIPYTGANAPVARANVPYVPAEGAPTMGVSTPKIGSPSAEGRVSASGVPAMNGNAPTSAMPASKQQSVSRYSYELVCGENGCVNQPRYNTVCKGECKDIFDTNDNIITSEFTEESFNISDYVKPEIDANEIAFENIGTSQKIITDIDINEVKISDNTILTWEAEEGDNLRELLTKWSAMSGWKLLWQTNRNYVLNAGVMFKGKFADVSSALVRAFARARPAPIATYYKGNRVIVIETMENENAY